MRKSQAIVIAVLVAVGAALGAFALARTTRLGVEARQASDRSVDAAVAVRTRRLDSLERSLRRALAKKPPKLPPLPKIQAPPSVPVRAPVQLAPAASAPPRRRPRAGARS
jgi:outer membrane protein TolC